MTNHPKLYSLKTTVNFIFILLICSNSFAQSVIGDSSQSKHSLKKGAWSMQFLINREFSLSPFTGNVISAKYHIKNNRAVRFGLSLSSDVGNDNGDERHSDNAWSDNKEEDYNAQAININVLYLFYPQNKNDIKLYGGAGPDIKFSQSHTEGTEVRVRQDTPDYISDYNNKYKQLDLGIKGVLGVEWFFKHNMSLIAEYGLFMGYYYSNEDEERIDRFQDEEVFQNLYTQTFNVNSYKVNGTSVKFGLSVYF